MSDFAFQPSTQTRGTSPPRVLKVQYGEGYQQRVADGPNSMLQKWTLIFTNRSPSYIYTIVAFLVTKQGVTRFSWTPLAPFDGVEIKVVCESWEWVYDAGGGIIGLSCEFQQVAEP